MLSFLFSHKAERSRLEQTDGTGETSFELRQHLAATPILEALNVRSLISLGKESGATAHADEGKITGHPACGKKENNLANEQELRLYMKNHFSVRI